MLNIGHRGAKGYLPENTLASFQKAIALGADGIELDVHLSCDGEIMVIHDATVDRTTSGNGFVKELSSTHLKSLGIPTLEDVFELINRQGLINIELKAYESAEKVAELIENYVSEKHWDYHHFLVSSFDWNALQQVRFLNDKILIGVLTEDNLDLAFAFAKFIRAYSIHPYYPLLTKENTAQLQSKNLKVLPWTINEPEAIIFAKSLAVDGIITDFPDRI